MSDFSNLKNEEDFKTTSLFEQLEQETIIEFENKEFVKDINSFYDDYLICFKEAIPIIKLFSEIEIQLDNQKVLTISNFYKMLDKKIEDDDDYIWNCKDHKEDPYTIFCLDHERNFCEKCVVNGLCSNRDNQYNFAQKKEITLNDCNRKQNILKQSKSYTKYKEEKIHLLEICRENIKNNSYNYIFFQIIEKMPI